MSENKKTSLDNYLETLDKNYDTFKIGIQDFIHSELENVINKNNKLQKELNDYREEVKNLNKVSIISNLNKQIKNLTKDIEMYKLRQKNKQKTIDDLNIRLEKIIDENDILRGANNININIEEESDIDCETPEVEYYEIEIGKQTYCVDDNDNIYKYDNEEVGDIIGILVNNNPYFKQILYFSPLQKGHLFNNDDYENNIGKLNKVTTKQLISELME